MLYVVNGAQFEGSWLDSNNPRVASGARLSIKVSDALDLDGSHAQLWGLAEHFHLAAETSARPWGPSTYGANTSCATR